MTDEIDDFYDDPIDALAELFAVADPEPDPRFADRLESDLRIAHAERNLARRPSRVGSKVTALATLALVILVAATVSLLWRDRSVSSALEMSNADGVVVTLPDGSTVDDPADGFDLPEGTVIAVRVGGSVTIDDVSLRDGVVVTVRDGTLVTDAPVTTTTDQPAERVARDGGASEPTVPPRSDDVRPSPMPPELAVPEPVGPVATDPGPPNPVPSPDRPADHRTDRPAESVEPPPVGPQPSSMGSRSPRDATAPHPSMETPGVDLALAVKIDGNAGSIAVTWSAGRAMEPTWRVLVIRSIGESKPDWPLGPSTVLIGESTGGGRSKVIDQPGPDATVVNYRLVVVDGADGVVARGAIQSARLR